MEGKKIFKGILITVIYIVVLIVSVILVSIIVASIASRLTQNENTIVIACLISVWITGVTINVLRCYVMFNKRKKELDKNNMEEYEKEIKRLKKKNFITAVLFSVCFGFVVYNLKDQLIGSLTNETQQTINENTVTSPTFYLKIGITVILVMVLIIKRIITRKNKNGNMEKEKN